MATSIKELDPQIIWKNDSAVPVGLGKGTRNRGFQGRS